MSGLGDHAPVLAWAIDITALLMLIAIALSFLRLVRGPTLPDRVVALDLITIITVGFVGLFAIASDVSAFLDVAIGLALVAFLATVAFAWYADRRAAQFGQEGDLHDREGDR
ncbi:cation:proton antiporter [Algihabitans albus]|uniref:monovalent cation/H+ antiporter complex subunit F n=1 Tax=Algihabitans albus TaxID=2164067 RepID=UPI0035D0D127